MKNYIGQKVCWDLIYKNITKISGEDEGQMRVHLMSEKGSELVVCEINEKEFPIIKILPPNTAVRIVGKIQSIDRISIDINEAQLQEIRDGDNQIYFPEGSRESLLAFLEGKILGAEDIKIYDSHPGEDILKLLESSSLKAKIELLGNNIDKTFLEKSDAFAVYFNRNLSIKKTNVSHARFYIIDGEVFQVDSSLKNSGGNKATMVHKIDKETETIKEDFKKWSIEATILMEKSST